MKKNTALAVFVVFLFCIQIRLPAQSAAQGAAQGAAQLPASIQTKNYLIASNGRIPFGLDSQLETLFEIYNRVFMFGADSGELPLRVNIFTDNDAYNAHIRDTFAPQGYGILYLHYAQAEKRELVINAADTEIFMSEKGNSLPYQAFIQFLRAFIPHPPIWLQKGFASYFSTITFNKDGSAAYEENLSWLNIVKDMEDIPSLREILLFSSDNAEESESDFNSLAASAASFLLNSGKEEYARSFSAGLKTLSRENSAALNAGAFMNSLLLDCTIEELTADYERYLASRKTFSELIAEGQNAYSSGDLAGAELSFRAALEVRSGHFLPWYYLGLLAYNANDFYAARAHYHCAAERGADAALVYYALGINAAAAGNNGEAVDYLRRAARESPERYEERAQRVIRQLR